MKIHVFLVVVVLGSKSVVVQGQEKDPWIGRRVFTQFGAVMKVGNEVVDDKGRSRSIAITGHDRGDSTVYRVEHVNGEWLWLKDENSSKAGWVQIKCVVPYEQAVEFYTTKIRTNPESSNYNSRGSIWHEKGEYDIAIADYNEAIRLEPGYATYWSNRGRTWSRKKEYDKAIADQSEAIRLDPKYSSAYNSRAYAWSCKGDYDEAIADYNEAIRLDPRDSSTYLNRGGSWFAKKDYDNAIADYNEAIRLDPKHALAYENRGYASETKKEYDKAITDYNESIRLDPKDSYPYSRQAWIWATCPDEKYRDGKKAVEFATRACKLSEWKAANRLDKLAAAYAESCDFEKAVEWQEKANNLYTDPEDKKKGLDRLKLFKEKKPYRDEN